MLHMYFKVISTGALTFMLWLSEVILNKFIKCFSLKPGNISFTAVHQYFNANV